MANVRETDGVDDHIFLHGSGTTLAGWGLIWVGRLMSLTATQAIMAAVDTPAASQGVLYYDASQEISYGSGAGDLFTNVFTLNATDVWALGFTKAAGTTAITFHARNLTTAAASSHQATGGTVADTGGTWDETEIGAGDGGSFVGNKRHACAAVFTTAYSNAGFDTVLNSSLQIAALNPARMWDFNQASVATPVDNLLTTSSDQTAIVGTTVVNDAAFDFWSFGLGITGSSNSTGPGVAGEFSPYLNYRMWL